LLKNSVLVSGYDFSLVSGHDFSRAEEAFKTLGFSPWANLWLAAPSAQAIQTKTGG
jgi:hypothetical protein